MGRKEFYELLEDLVQKKNTLVKEPVNQEKEKVREILLKQIDAEIVHLKLLQ